MTGRWRRARGLGKVEDLLSVGIMCYPNGDKYDGEWKEDMKEGKGRVKYANGDSFDGEFKEDSKSGEGVYTYASGEKHSGTWPKDKSADERTTP